MNARLIGEAAPAGLQTTGKYPRKLIRRFFCPAFFCCLFIVGQGRTKNRAMIV
jgi:hypothetical protein